MADDAPLSPLVFRERFVSSEPGEFEEFIRATYADIALRPAEGPTRLACRHDTVGAKGFAISRIRTSLPFSGVVRSMEGLLGVVTVRTGRIGWDFGHRREVDLGPNDVALTDPFDEYVLVNDQADADVIALDGPAVDAYAAHACGTPAGGLRFTGMVPISAALARYWNATVVHVRDEVLGNPEAATSALLVDNAFELLAAALLSTFPNTALAAVTDPQARRPRGEVSEARLHEVVNYLDTHAHRPVRAAEIADVAGVPARDVVEALRRHHDTSPTKLLRAARLRGVHRELRDADPLTGPTVTAVAVRWGFAHPGPFRGAYAAMFDEQPEDTLRR